MEPLEVKFALFCFWTDGPLFLVFLVSGGSFTELQWGMEVEGWRGYV